MSLHRLLFDPANPVESANVGANLKSGLSGALLTNTGITLAASGSFNFVDADVTPASDTIAETAHGFQTGRRIQLTTSGVLPAGLALATDYYVIRVDANTIKLAASPSDAELGVAVDITAAAGGGTHTLTGFEMQIRALDVSISSPVTVSGSVTVSATDLDIRDLVFATDKVDVSGSTVELGATTLAALETITVLQGTSPWVVSATDLDIRDLTHVSDSVKVGDGTDFLAVNADGSINITDNGGSLTVDAVNLDIRDLVAATDSVSAHTKDGAGTSITSTLVSGKQGLDVNVVNSIDVDDGLANTAIDAGAETVTTSSAALITSPLASRKYVYIYNNGNKAIFIGESGISAAQGFPVFPGNILDLRVGAAVAIHAVSDSGSQNIRVLQAS